MRWFWKRRTKACRQLPDGRPAAAACDGLDTGQAFCRIPCVHQIQMSPSLPFTDVTGVGRGALAQRSARPAPDAAEEEAALVVLPSEWGASGLVETFGCG